MVERSASDLTTNEKEELYKLLLEYADVFAESSAELGRTNLIKHSIDAGNEHPIRGNHVDECHQRGGSRLEGLSTVADPGIRQWGGRLYWRGGIFWSALLPPPPPPPPRGGGRYK